MNAEEDPTERVGHALDDLGAAVREAAPRAARREVRRLWPLLSAANIIITLVLVLVVTDQGGAISDLQAAAEVAKPQGDRANEELEQRGQQPVPIPEPGTGVDLEVIVSTATARVLAGIPDPRPSASQLGAAVARYLADHPPGPTPAQLARSLAAYLAANPPPAGPTGPSGVQGMPCDPAAAPECRGPQGEQGQPGRPPTAEEIQAALADYIRDNPDVLCPRGGRFALAQVRLAGGGSADAWTCVVTEYPAPPSTTDTTPAPTSTAEGAPPLLPLPRR